MRDSGTQPAASCDENGFVICGRNLQIYHEDAALWVSHLNQNIPKLLQHHRVKQKKCLCHQSRSRWAVRWTPRNRDRNAAPGSPLTPDGGLSDSLLPPPLGRD
jgi:hypothetical protein